MSFKVCKLTTFSQKIKIFLPLHDKKDAYTDSSEIYTRLKNGMNRYL